MPVLELLAHVAPADDLGTLTPQVFLKARPTLPLPSIGIIRQASLRRLCLGASDRWVTWDISIVDIPALVHAPANVFAVEDGVEIV